MYKTTEYVYQQLKLSEDQPNMFFLYLSQLYIYLQLEVSWGICFYHCGYLECMHDQKVTDL